MNEKNKDYEQFSTSLPIKFIKLLRLHAFKSETSLSQMLVNYQNNHVEKLEHEKIIKKLNKEIERELDEKGQVKCPKCDQ